MTTLTAESHNDVISVMGKGIQYKWIVAIVYVSALFLDILDTTIVNVALIKMGQDFRTDAVECCGGALAITLAGCGRSTGGGPSSQASSSGQGTPKSGGVVRVGLMSYNTADEVDRLLASVAAFATSR